VDDSGKVQRLRKQCPNCGPGIFMATHFDRVYCGKCGATFLYEDGPKQVRGLICCSRGPAALRAVASSPKAATAVPAATGSCIAVACSPLTIMQVAWLCVALS
jgi:ribosomal protein S27AE